MLQNQIQIKDEQLKDYQRIAEKGWENNERVIREAQGKEVENIKIKLNFENEKKINNIEREYKEKLEKNKKEMK